MIVDQELFNNIPPKSNIYITCCCDKCGEIKQIRKYAITKRGEWTICKICFNKADLLSRSIRRVNIPKKYSKNENFFNEPNHINSYWAGFIAADGCLRYNERGRANLTITLHVLDKLHIQKFIDDSKYTGIISEGTYSTPGYKPTPRVSATVCSAHQWLSDLNTNWFITPNKTYTLRSPNLNYQNSLAYVAGYIDGDGCFYIKKTGKIVIKIVGTRAILEWIKQQIDSLTGIPSGQVYKCSWANAYQYFISCQSSVKKLTEEVQKLNLPLMERKWSKVL